MPSLDLLNLQKNKIEDVNFKECMQLKEVYLQENPIVSIRNLPPRLEKLGVSWFTCLMPKRQVV